ncbi:type III secretion system chaperone [Hydrogenophaga sp.]|uniref:type III secretion system chaperone n=2 Tax=Hydrogenophaga sp. TaxID=1904254 RepID=UPI00169A4FF6|nr:type III secretion system chaperone [Hydrogenophaga sp.]NIQ64528.1 hypothetical protein [Hydrogenophaga sp.]
MALDLLTRWTQDFCRMRGCSARALDGAPGVVLDAGAASLIAVEWQPGTHTLHVYGHPGDAARVGPPQLGAPGSEWDDDEADDGSDAWRGGGCHPVRIGPGGDENEGATLHLDPDTGLVTLYLVVPFATLDAQSFATTLDAFIDDLALWSTVFAPSASVDPGAGGAQGDETARAMASGLIFA